MQAKTPFFVEVNTPLGPAILIADTQGLSGLYFADQRDCPVQVASFTTNNRINDPTLGERQGLPLSKMKVGQDATVKHFQNNLLAPPGQLKSGRQVSRVGERHASNTTPATIKRYFDQAIDELDAYFHGQLKHFTVPLSLHGTDFQRKVWQTLAKLPMSQTMSYGQLGYQAGVAAGAFRAVGVAVGRNPVSIIVPCHRIVSSSRRLTGYGGGLERKVALLEHEGFQVSCPLL